MILEDKEFYLRFAGVEVKLTFPEVITPEVIVAMLIKMKNQPVLLRNPHHISEDGVHIEVDENEENSFFSFEISSCGTYYKASIQEAFLHRDYLIVPSQHQGLPVKEIGCRPDGIIKVEVVYIPDSIEKIEDGALNALALKQVVFGRNVREIGKEAFSDNEIQVLSLPSSLESIGAAAFKNNKVKSLFIPRSVQFLGAESFQLNRLESLVIEGAVEVLEERAFADNVLDLLLLPEEVKVIKESCFQDNRLKEVYLHDGLEELGRNAFAENELHLITLPESLIEIGDFAFAQNELEEVRIPPRVGKVGTSVFFRNKIRELVLCEDSDESIRSRLLSMRGRPNVTTYSRGEF